MVEVVWGRLLTGRRRRRRHRRDRGQLFAHIVVALRWATALAVLALIGWSIAAEIRTSYLQSRVFSALARQMTYTVEPGASRTIIFPRGGPYDQRLGYAELPRFIGALGRDGYQVGRQARWSPPLERFVENGGYAIYHEKSRAGLELFDRDGAVLYRARYPALTYRDFAAIPPLVVDSLLYIEDRDLLAANDPERDPAIDWQRFALAVGGRVAGLIDPHWRHGGASTLATQTVKFRHSPQGRTPDIREKLRQMVTAAIHAYRHGPDTLAARQNIVTTYLDAEPLGSRQGYGEIIGVPEALWRWYGTDPSTARRVLTAPAATPAELARKGEIYRQVLSLLLAGRRPAYYLNADHPAALAALTDRYLGWLSTAGIIDPALREAALAAPLGFTAEPAAPAARSYIADKASDQLRDQLVSRLDLTNYYALDHLDLRGWSSIDGSAQERVSSVLSQLGDPGYDRSLGLYGRQLLGSASPARLAWSVVLYERGAGANYVRIRADSLNQPFDINAGAKLMLGSTAKLRTLITYLDIVAALHRNLAPLPRGQLLAAAAAASADPIARWAANYLAAAKDRGLEAMLEAAMQRTYSASPGTFFTGGGMQSFENFAKWENHERPTVAEAFANSVNLAFVRLMRQVVDHYIAADGQSTELLRDPNNPERMIYLWRFADQEGREYLDRFWPDYHGRTPQQALDLLASRTRPDPRRLAVVFRSVEPDAGKEALAAFLARQLPRAAISDGQLWDLYREASPRTVSLRDRGTIAGVHPLELWLVAYLRTHPDASRANMLRASERARQEVYAWLFRRRSARLQTQRIRTLLEQQAFDGILQDWRRQGYPFDRLVPSLGTVLGSSGDRPDALATLIGIIVNDGVRQPTVALERLDFATGTPYETDLVAVPRPQRVLDPAVARTVRQALLSVVARGTGTAVRGVYRTADGSPLAVGGKTGTGDNRFDHFGSGGRMIGQRVVDRTATFVFFLGSRFFGTVTAYVPGAIAARYDFTSALAVRLLKAIKPQLEPLLRAPAPGAPSAKEQASIEISDTLHRSLVAN